MKVQIQNIANNRELPRLDNVCLFNRIPSFVNMEHGNEEAFSCLKYYLDKCSSGVFNNISTGIFISP